MIFRTLSWNISLSTSNLMCALAWKFMQLSVWKAYVWTSSKVKRLSYSLRNSYNKDIFLLNDSLLISNKKKLLENFLYVFQCFVVFLSFPQVVGFFPPLLRYLWLQEKTNNSFIILLLLSNNCVNWIKALIDSGLVCDRVLHQRLQLTSETVRIYAAY